MGVKSLDFFRKLNTDNETSSAIGGVLTFLAFVITSVLVYNETKLYLKTELSYSAVIDNDTEQFINIHIDITIHAPCMALSLDQQDEVGVHRLDVQDTLRKIRQDRAGRSIKDTWGVGQEAYRGSRNELNDLVKAINDGETCRFVGYITVNKVPGNFHISYHAYHQLMQGLYMHEQTHYRKMKLDHTIHSIHFGDTQMSRAVLGKYIERNIPSFPKAFQQYFSDIRTISKSSPENTKNDYEYHIKALPARFQQDPAESRLLTLYKYSITHTEAAKSQTEMDSIYFRYQMNPVNMVYSIKPRNFYHFLVQLCAIIGGVFAVLGMINSVLQKLN